MSTTISTGLFNSSGAMNSPVINANAVTVSGSSSALLTKPSLAAQALATVSLPSYITDSSYNATNPKQVQMVLQSFATNLHRQPSEGEFNTAVAGLVAVTDDTNMTGTNNMYWGAAAFDNSLVNTTEFNTVHGLLGTLPGSLVGKTYVIAGMNSGQGFMTAVQLAQAGAEVYGFARTPEVYYAHVKSAIKTQWENNMPWEQYNGPIGVASSVFDNITFVKQDVRDLSGLTVYFKQFNYLDGSGTKVTGTLGDISLDGVLMACGINANSPELATGTPEWLSSSYISIAEDIAATPNRFVYPECSFNPSNPFTNTGGASSARYNNNINIKFWGGQFVTGLAVKALAVDPSKSTSLVYLGSLSRILSYNSLYTAGNKMQTHFLSGVTQYVSKMGYNIRVNNFAPPVVDTALNIALNSFSPSFQSKLLYSLTSNNMYQYVQTNLQGLLPFADYFSTFVQCDPSGNSTNWYVNQVMNAPFNGDPLTSGLMSTIIISYLAEGTPTYGLTQLWDSSSNGYMDALRFRNFLFNYRIVNPMISVGGVYSPVYMAAHLVDALINQSKNGLEFFGGCISTTSNLQDAGPTNPQLPINYYNWNNGAPQLLRAYIAGAVANADIKSYSGYDYLPTINGTKGYSIF